MIISPLEKQEIQEIEPSFYPLNYGNYDREKYRLIAGELASPQGSLPSWSVLTQTASVRQGVDCEPQSNSRNTCAEVINSAERTLHFLSRKSLGGIVPCALAFILDGCCAYHTS